MIARAADTLGQDAVLTGAKFLRISDKTLTLSTREEATAHPLAEISFAKADGTTRVLCLNETSETAPRRYLALNCTVSRLDDADDEAVRYRFAAAPPFECRLNALVQAVKTEQSHRYGAIRNNWFTGLRRCSLSSFDRSAAIQDGEITLVFDRISRMGSFNNVLYRFSMCARSAEKAEGGLISFAFQAKETGNAA